jgi:glutaredoxin 3
MITVYSKPLCPYCDGAKMYLERHGFEYQEVNVMEDPAALKFIKEEKGHRSVPQIYLGDTILVEGGYDGLNKLTPTQLTERIEKINASK